MFYNSLNKKVKHTHNLFRTSKHFLMTPRFTASFTSSSRRSVLILRAI